MTSPTGTLRELSGLALTPAPLTDSALVMIDCQNTYREGVMKLEGVEEALAEGRRLLEAAREFGVPVIHIQHDAGAGSPYDIRAEIGAIADVVAPLDAEPVVVKHYPNSFVQTDLEERLRALGITNVVLAGFMTHMCVNSTAHGAFNLGFAPTVVASATATRGLTSVGGRDLTAEQVHHGALASTRDLYAAVVDDVASYLAAART